MRALRRPLLMHLAAGASVLFLHAAAEVALAQGSSTQPLQRTQRFDGTWDTTIVCPNASNAALTTTERLTVDIKDGTLSGGLGVEGEPGSLRLVGRVGADGTAEIGARGLAGERRYNIDPPRGSPISYFVRARFDDTRGTGSRVGKTCDFTFVRR